MKVLSPSQSWFSAFDEAVVKEQPIRQLAFCDFLPSLEATEASRVFTDLWIWKLFCQFFKQFHFNVLFLSIESVVEADQAVFNVAVVNPHL